MFGPTWIDMLYHKNMEKFEIYKKHRKKYLLKDGLLVDSHLMKNL